MDRSLVKYFWDCGDSQIIDFAVMRARLNRKEKTVIHLILDECLTQEQASEEMDLSTRRFQEYWYSATNKILSIPWVIAYAESLKKQLQ